MPLTFSWARTCAKILAVAGCANESKRATSAASAARASSLCAEGEGAEIWGVRGVVGTMGDFLHDCASLVAMDGVILPDRGGEPNSSTHPTSPSLRRLLVGVGVAKAPDGMPQTSSASICDFWSAGDDARSRGSERLPDFETEKIVESPTLLLWTPSPCEPAAPSEQLFGCS